LRSKGILLTVSIPVTLVASAGTPGPASAEVYWSPKRMAAATPLDARHTVRSKTEASRPPSHTWTGSPVVGALFLSNGSGSHYCTASVVDTPKKSLLLTAAHCLYGSGGWAKNVAFVPRYSRGSRPYGTWTVRYMYVDSRWKTKRDPDLDFGFAALGTRKGKRIANVVGADHLVTDQGYTDKVRVIGYPMKKYASVDKPIYCNATTHKAFKYQIRFDCGGFYGGTSGSPWIKNYNTKTRRGDVLGVIGGYQEGGKYDWRSYSPVFDKDIRHLYTLAEAHG
jgi:V8-like Glu-specific endopeptidase